MATSAEFNQYRTYSTQVSLDELARRKGARPVKSIHDLAAPEIFETDEELDEFLVYIRAEREASIA